MSEEIYYRTLEYFGVQTFEQIVFPRFKKNDAGHNNLVAFNRVMALKLLQYVWNFHDSGLYAPLPSFQSALSFVASIYDTRFPYVDILTGAVVGLHTVDDFAQFADDTIQGISMIQRLSEQHHWKREPSASNELLAPGVGLPSVCTSHSVGTGCTDEFERLRRNVQIRIRDKTVQNQPSRPLRLFWTDDPEQVYVQLLKLILSGKRVRHVTKAETNEVTTFEQTAVSPTYDETGVQLLTADDKRSIHGFALSLAAQTEYDYTSDPEDRAVAFLARYAARDFPLWLVSETTNGIKYGFIVTAEYRMTRVDNYAFVSLEEAQKTLFNNRKSETIELDKNTDVTTFNSVVEHVREVFVKQTPMLVIRNDSMSLGDMAHAMESWSMYIQNVALLNVLKEKRGDETLDITADVAARAGEAYRIADEISPQDSQANYDLEDVLKALSRHNVKEAIQKMSSSISQLENHREARNFKDAAIGLANNGFGLNPNRCNVARYFSEKDHAVKASWEEISKQMIASCVYGSVHNGWLDCGKEIGMVLTHNSFLSMALRLSLPVVFVSPPLGEVLEEWEQIAEGLISDDWMSKVGGEITAKKLVQTAKSYDEIVKLANDYANDFDEYNWKLVAKFIVNLLVFLGLTMLANRPRVRQGKTAIEVFSYAYLLSISEGWKTLGGVLVLICVRLNLLSWLRSVFPNLRGAAGGGGGEAGDAPPPPQEGNAPSNKEKPAAKVEQAAKQVERGGEEKKPAPPVQPREGGRVLTTTQALNNGILGGNGGGSMVTPNQQLLGGGGQKQQPTQGQGGRGGVKTRRNTKNGAAAAAAANDSGREVNRKREANTVAGSEPNPKQRRTKASPDNLGGAAPAPPTSGSKRKRTRGSALLDVLYS
ncbi:unnamed protein product [Ectocarpus sp. 6 AP-2014]